MTSRSCVGVILLATLTGLVATASADSSTSTVTSLAGQQLHRASDPTEPWSFNVDAQVGFGSRQHLFLQSSGQAMRVNVPPALGHISEQLLPWCRCPCFRFLRSG